MDNMIRRGAGAIRDLMLIQRLLARAILTDAFRLLAGFAWIMSWCCIIHMLRGSITHKREHLIEGRILAHRDEDVFRESCNVE